MVLSRLTKITGPGVATDTNWVGNNADFTGITTTATSFNIGVTTIHSTLIESHNIKSTGIITAVSFVGDGTGLTGVANTDFVVGTAITMTTANFTGDVEFGGNVSIAGTLTYEDVTNIDSIGIVTARDGFKVLGGGANIVGVVTATGADINGDLDVDGHTNLDNVSVAGVTTFVDGVASKFGTDGDGSIKHTGTNLQIFETTGNIQITNYANDKDVVISSDDGSGGTASYFTADGSTGKASLSYYGSTKLTTDSVGVDITGTCTDDGARHDGDVYFIGATSGRNVVWDMSADSLEFADNAKLAIGSGTDLLIYHDGSNSLIRSGGTGQLQIESSNNTSIVMGNAGLTETIFKGSVNGSVELYHDNSKKFETSAKGIQVGTGVTIETNGQATFTGIVTASTYYGDGSNLSNITSTTINNNANNRIITGSGTANTLEGEANLNFDGTGLGLVGHIDIRTGSSINTNVTGGGASGTLHKNTTSGEFAIVSGGTGGNNHLTFYTSASAAPTEKLRITSDGRMLLGTTSANHYSDRMFTINRDAGAGIELRNNGSSTGQISFSDTSGSGIGGYRGYIQFQHNNGSMHFATQSTERLRIDSSGRVLIGGGNSPSQVGDGQLIVYSSDRLHPAIKCAGMSNNYANGWTLLGDNYQADESQINLGVSYSSSGLVLSRGVKVSGSADDVYLSSQDSFATRPCAIKLDYLGAFNFLTTETNATVATDSAVSLTEVFKIDRVGNIYQKITNRFMYFGASNVMRIGTNGSDPMIDAVSGDLQIKDAGNNICTVRSDGFEMYEGIYPSADGGEDLGKSSRRWNNIYTNDLHLSNEGKSNVVDGTWGDWTLQEGESDVYMINNRSGKKFKIRMEEVS